MLRLTPNPAFNFRERGIGESIHYKLFERSERMKTFYFVVTGAFVAQVKGETEDKAQTSLGEWLQENSPIRDWEVGYNLY